FGNLCDTKNFGDPVVLYDTFEDRWVITDFAFTLTGGNVNNPPGSFECIAVSKTGDPVSGGWNFYSINTTGGLAIIPSSACGPTASTCRRTCSTTWVARSRTRGSTPSTRRRCTREHPRFRWCP